MYKVSIVIPFISEFYFLNRNIAQIKKLRHPQVEYEILLIDQSGTNEMLDKYAGDAEIKVIQTAKVDAGFPINVGIEHSTGQWHCTLDVDAIPISNLFAYLPIKVAEKFGFIMVGQHTGLQYAYKEQCGGFDFVGLNNYYRTMPMHIARQLAKEVGFMRPENRYKVNFTPLYDNWPGSADNGVVVSWHSDKQKMGPKLSLAMDKYLGRTTQSGLFGFTIDSLVFHMVFAYPDMHNPDQALGAEYLAWMRRIKDEGLTEQLFDKILSKLQPLYSTKLNRETWIDGKLESIGEGNEVYEYIEAIKRGEV